VRAIGFGWSLSRQSAAKERPALSEPNRVCCFYSGEEQNKQPVALMKRHIVIPVAHLVAQLCRLLTGTLASQSL